MHRASGMVVLLMLRCFYGITEGKSVVVCVWASPSRKHNLAQC